MTYKVILYYKYVNLSDPLEVVDWHKKFCAENNLKGRVLIAHEGINGTLGGLESDIDKYIQELSKDSRFSHIDFKASYHNENPFPKLKVKLRKEIVTLGLPEDIDMSLAQKGTYLTPEELQAKIDQKEKIIFVDARNDYESRIGRFKDAITPNIKTFKEFPLFLKSIEHLKNETLVSYCTGGIRCEKATAYAIQQGFKKVFHLKGGIHRYLEKFPNGAFEGSLYVFDERISIVFGKDKNRKILTNCVFCGKPYDTYKNCFNAKCNKRFIVCDDCYREHQGFCSTECAQTQHNKRKDAEKFMKILCKSGNS